jgi:hypothetical protein
MPRTANINSVDHPSAENGALDEYRDGANLKWGSGMRAFSHEKERPWDGRSGKTRGTEAGQTSC